MRKLRIREECGWKVGNKNMTVYLRFGASVERLAGKPEKKK